MQIIFVDADKVILSNVDDLFQLSAPAATFGSPWAEAVADHQPVSIPPLPPSSDWHSCCNAERAAGSLVNPYMGIRHGEPVTPDAIRCGLTRGNSFVCVGTMILLRPSRSDHAAFLDMMRPHLSVGASCPQKGGTMVGVCLIVGIRILKNNVQWAPCRPRSRGGSGEPFGFDCYSMVDEQSIAWFYASYRNRVAQPPTPVSSFPSPGLLPPSPPSLQPAPNWTMIDPRYNLIPWHPEWLDACADDRPRVFHYFGKNPWQQWRGEWADLEAWWLMAAHLLDDKSAHHVHSICQSERAMDFFPPRLLSLRTHNRGGALVVLANTKDLSPRLARSHTPR